MSSSNCCFLTCIQISLEAGQVIWYSHLFKNFPQFVVIHTVCGDPWLWLSANALGDFQGPSQSSPNLSLQPPSSLLTLHGRYFVSIMISLKTFSLLSSALSVRMHSWAGYSGKDFGVRLQLRSSSYRLCDLSQVTSSLRLFPHVKKWEL